MSILLLAYLLLISAFVVAYIKTNSKKIKRLEIIFISTVVGAAVVYSAFFDFLIPAYYYKKGETAYFEEKYTLAIEMYGKASGYKDADYMAMEARREKGNKEKYEKLLKGYEMYALDCAVLSSNRITFENVNSENDKKAEAFFKLFSFLTGEDEEYYISMLKRKIFRNETNEDLKEDIFSGHKITWDYNEQENFTIRIEYIPY